VQDAVHDAFVHKLARAVSELRVGDGLEPGVTQGPLIDARALAKLESLVDDARRKGGRVVAGGRRHRLGGTFYEPTLIVEARADMEIAREEAFGPVAPVFRFRDEAEAVRMANDTEYGLAAYFYSRDLARAWRVAGQLEYGMVGINSGLLSTAVAPFGGVKQSGYGREGSRHGIDDYVHLKYLCMGVE
jgi:succinate-semialdehyde dehydrogenase/glutarate-semialdehyde dehydrogenase